MLKSSTRWIGAAVAVIVGCDWSPAQAQSEPPLTKEEVYRLTPTSDYGRTPEETQANAQRLRDYGERAYPALVEIILEEDEPLIVSNAIDIICSSSGDKKVLRDALAPLLQKWSGKPFEGSIRFSVVVALGEIGTAAEVPLLFPILDDKDANLTVIAAECIAKLGTEADAKRLETWLQAKRNSFATDEEEYKLYPEAAAEVEAAITALRARLKDK